QGTDSSCMLPHTKTTILGKPEDLTNLSQLVRVNLSFCLLLVEKLLTVLEKIPVFPFCVSLCVHFVQNYSNSVSMLLQCRLSLSPSKGLKLTFIGRLQLPALHAVSFRSLELLTVASIQLEKSNPMFLQEDNLVIQVQHYPNYY
ncbi:hypothetical protein ILYODFUR_033242, partial [Ilyodon furcidens]